MTALVEVRDLVKHYPIRSGIVFRRDVGSVKAVDSISFDLEAGETFALVGESGCGKSTTARCVLRLIEPTSGSISFEGEDITNAGAARMRTLRRQMQMIFQDPFASLNPRMTVRGILREPFAIHGLEEEGKVEALLDMVGLVSEHASRYPHEFSEGSASERASPGPSPSTPSWSSATSRCRRSTCPSGPRSSTSWRTCRAGWGLRSCSSPTT